MSFFSTSRSLYRAAIDMRRFSPLVRALPNLLPVSDGKLRCSLVQVSPKQLGEGSTKGTVSAIPVRYFSSNASSDTDNTTKRKKKITTVDLRLMKKKNDKITMVTAYDYPSAVHVDLAGMEVLLVGDSVGMVELGMDTTISVTLDDIIHHCKAVKRGAQRPLIVSDMPFGTCEGDPNEALKNAQRLLKEGQVDAVKIEGGVNRAETVKKLVQGGIAVMGHVGLLPQHISVLGGFRAQGKTAEHAKRIIDDALAIQAAGAFAVVLECVPEVVAEQLTRILDIPTIGIGAGGKTDGQVLVYHDMLGMLQHPHHAQFVPKFCKRYADVGNAIRVGLEDYRNDVKNGEFPSPQYSPYKMSKDHTQKFLDIVEDQYGEYLKENVSSSPEIVSEETKVY